MEFILTDFPVPVAPAIRRWGIFSRPAYTGLPETSRPKASGRKYFDFLYSSSSNIPLKPTRATFLFGTSMPTRDFPGIGASILMGWAAKAKAKLFDSVVILESFTPSAGLKAYWVTAGPTFTSAISTGMPKFSKVFLMISEFSLIFPEVGTVSFLLNKSIGGKAYFPFWVGSEAFTNTGTFSLPWTASKGFCLNNEVLGWSFCSGFSGSTPFILKFGASELLSSKPNFFSSLGNSCQINCKKINRAIKIMAEKIILETNNPKPLTKSLATKPTSPICWSFKLWLEDSPETPTMAIQIAKRMAMIFAFLCDLSKTKPPANSDKIMVVIVILESPNNSFNSTASQWPSIPAFSKKERVIMMATKKSKMALIHFFVREVKRYSFFLGLRDALPLLPF